MQNAIGSLIQAVHGAAGGEVTYSRGATDIVVTAAPGNTLTESTFADGSVRTTRIADFLIKVADLGLTPKQGDRITWDGRLYEVRHPSGGRVFDEAGPYKQLFRVHTVEVNGS